jgi:hypothetical protein
MKLTVALYRQAGRPDDTPMALNADYGPGAYAGYVRITEPVTVDFPDIVADPAVVLAALNKEEAAALANHERMMADIASRRAKVGL